MAGYIPPVRSIITWSWHLPCPCPCDSCAAGTSSACAPEPEPEPDEELASEEMEEHSEEEGARPARGDGGGDHCP